MLLRALDREGGEGVVALQHLPERRVAEERDDDEVAQHGRGDRGDEELPQRPPARDAGEEDARERSPRQPEGPEEERPATYPRRAVGLEREGLSSAIQRMPFAHRSERSPTCRSRSTAAGRSASGVLGWPAPEDRDRPRARPRTDADRVRRTRERPRSLDPVEDPRPLHRHPGAGRCLVPVRRPRPRRRAVHQSRRRGDARRRDHRARHRRDRHLHATHPYTQTLLLASPVPDPERQAARRREYVRLT